MNEEPEVIPVPTTVVKHPIHLVWDKYPKSVGKTTLCGLHWDGEDEAPPYVIVNDNQPFVSEGALNKAFVCEGGPEPLEPDPVRDRQRRMSQGPSSPLTTSIPAEDVCEGCLKFKPLKELNNIDL